MATRQAAVATGGQAAQAGTAQAGTGGTARHTGRPVTPGAGSPRSS